MREAILLLRVHVFVAKSYRSPDWLQAGYGGTRASMPKSCGRRGHLFVINDTFTQSLVNGHQRLKPQARPGLRDVGQGIPHVAGSGWFVDRLNRSPQDLAERVKQLQQRRAGAAADVEGRASDARNRCGQ